MTPDAASSPHSLATASGLLLGTVAAAMLVGALIGWALGSAGIGLLVGALLGIPIGVGVVYQVYGRSQGR
jgi:F0F1-type ATP synthase assembly protein I